MEFEIENVLAKEEESKALEMHLLRLKLEELGVSEVQLENMFSDHAF